MDKKIKFSLYRKIRDENIKKYKDVIEFHCSNNRKAQGIKGTNYDIYKYIVTRKLFKLSLKYPQFNLGFNWILWLRSYFKCNILLLSEVVEFLTTVRKSAHTIEEVNICSSIGYSKVLPFHYIDANL